LEDEATLRRIKHGKIVLVVTERTFVVPTQTVVDAQLLADLPRVLREERESLHEDEANRVADRDARTAYVSGEKVREREHIARCGGVRGPRALRAVEQNAGERVAVIELFKLRAAEFAAETELVLAGGVRNDVGQVPRNVLAAFRRGQAGFVEAGDLNVRRAGETKAVVNIQARAGEIEIRVEVAESLMEVVHAGEDLVREFWRPG